MESRKRSRTEDSEPVNAKKRVLSDSRDSPIPVNGEGHDTDEPRDNDNLEVSKICRSIGHAYLITSRSCSERMLFIVE